MSEFIWVLGQSFPNNLRLHCGYLLLEKRTGRYLWHFLVKCFLPILEVMVFFLVNLVDFPLILFQLIFQLPLHLLLSLLVLFVERIPLPLHSLLQFPFLFLLNPLLKHPHLVLPPPLCLFLLLRHLLYVLFSLLLQLLTKPVFWLLLLWSVLFLYLLSFLFVFLLEPCLLFLVLYTLLLL